MYRIIEDVCFTFSALASLTLFGILVLPQPKNHDWIVAKLDIVDIWLIDYFGGASIIKVDDYLNTQLLGRQTNDSS